MGASASNDDGIFAKELEDELMKFTTNCEEKKVGRHLVEQTGKFHKNTDMKFRTMECSTSGGNELVEAECSDTTECSSSFDDSDYGAEGVDTLGDFEALSDFHGDPDSELDFSRFDKFFSMRKKVSSHWRSFIHPIMWRCKWAELQIKKLEAQARKYERKLEEYSRKSTTEGPQSYVRSEVLRRKKRRRAEATNDLARYTSHHNLFSYYENRKFIRDVACHVLKNPADAAEEVNVDEEPWVNDEQLSVEAGNDDNFLEHIFHKIELLHSRVVKMKFRVEKVMSEQAGKFSCTGNLSSPLRHNTLMSSTANSSAPPSSGYRMPVGTYIASQLMSEYNMGGVLLPESAVANHGEVVPHANGSSDHAHFVNAYGNEDDVVLIDNQRVREEMRYFEEVKIHTIQRPLVLKDGLGSTNPPVHLLTDDQPPLPEIRSNSNLTGLTKSLVPAEADLLMDDQPPPEVLSMSNLANAPESKNKRGRRKGAAR